jgi:hypothetical protein
LLHFLIPDARERELGSAAPDDEQVRRIAALVVSRAQRRLGCLPDHVLAFRLPDPGSVLSSLPLEHRTSSALRRVPRNGAAPEPWTVARYLDVPRFGGRALVDLLASFEAHAAGSPATDGGPGGAASPAAAPVPALDGALTEICGDLPLSEAQVNGELLRMGAIERPTSLPRLARAAARLGWTPSFRVVDIGGTRVAVPRAHVTAAANTYRIAARAVHEWGAATVNAVLDQLRVVASAGVGAGFVRAILATTEDFQWLDPQRTWFWFAARPSRLLQNIKKVFSVVPELAVFRLRSALARTEAGANVPPAPVLCRICATLPGAFVKGTFVGIERLLDRASCLGNAERRVVEWFEDRRRSLPVGELGAVSQALGLSRWTVRRVLESSPLVEVLPGRRFGLI